MAQDDYYYEIQLTNKQLVFYFMAGATGLILSFLAGVMVGRGVDTAQGEVQARNVAEEKVVAEESVKATPSPADLTYAQRLESEKADAGLERPRGSGAEPAAAPSSKPAVGTAKPTTAPARPPASPPATQVATASPPPASVHAPGKAVPERTAKAAPPPPIAEPSFTIQVGAFKEKPKADSLITRLKGKGFAAYIVSPEGSDPGLFIVRVGHYAARADAEHAEAKLRDQEKFDPRILKQ
jgi:cell division septation protein DedD